MTADSDPKVSPTSDDLTRYLARYILEATREWIADYDIVFPTPVPAAVMFMAGSFDAYAEDPTRENLAEFLASVAGLGGALADAYQFPGGAGEEYSHDHSD